VTTPYGSWPSLLTADMVITGSVSLGEVVVGDDDIWWSELRPQEGGRVVVVRHTPGRDAVDVLPAGYSARTRAHEYGGAAWWLHDDTLVFANWADQRLYRIAPDTDPGQFLSPVPLTPEPLVPQGDRYADGVTSADGGWIICVRERHGVPGRSEALNEIVAIPAETGGEPVVLVSGPDFVASPRVAPGGQALCWLQWNHPDMPWDGTQLMVARLASGSQGCWLAEPVLVAGGRAESVVQPEWHADGSLWFVSDRSDWWNLHRVGLPGMQALLAGVPAAPSVEAVAPFRGEVGVPAWVFGQSRYAFLRDGRVALAYAADGVDHLAVLTPPDAHPADGGEPRAPSLVDLDTGFVSISSLKADGHGVVFVGASATDEAAVVVMDLPPNGDATMAQLRAPRDLGLEPAWFSRPQPLEVPTADGSTTYAIHYPPAHPRTAGPGGSAPPLLVLSHGGPTAAARPQLNLAIQYWTSRGFAVVDVNYRGSTGYGRAFRRALTGQWGELDVDDCVAVAQHLVAQGLADGSRIAIRGGSAGGYTTLCALAFRDAFRAGTSLYGVADLEALARDTHKFESRYLDSLVGPYPEDRDRYVERSPINHVAGFDCPLLVLQGLEDEIVPPAQSQMIVDAVKAKGVPVSYLTFEGEQHGFRQASSIKRALEAELYFYSRVFGFDLAEPIQPVPIDNL
jgi:dipeptidyl aminopeptidase/acylaminoacyl peptidase